MTTWSQNRWFHGAAVHGYLAHRVHAGVAIGLCDPVAVDDADRAVLLGEFADRARRDGLVPCVVAASADTAASAVGMGWRILRVGDEAVVDLTALSFQGRAWQDVRTALNHAARRGIAVTFGRLDDHPEGVRRQVAEISQRWTAGRRLPELGFTLGGLVEAADPEVCVAVAVDHDGTVHGVTSWLPSHRPSDGAVTGWTLDVMRRREDADGFRPVMELLIATSLARFRDEGCTWASLSASPLVRGGTPAESEGAAFTAAAVDRAVDRLAARLEPYYGFRSLHAFKAKFSPRFEPLYLVYPDDLALPRIGVALVRAYLPGVRLRDLAALSRNRPPRSVQASAQPRRGGGHQRQRAVVDPRRQGDGRGRADHVGVVHDEVDDALQVGVVTRDDPDEEVAGAGDRMRLQHLRDPAEVLDDRVVAAALPDLERAEGGDRVAEGSGVQGGCERADHASSHEPVEPGLDRAAGDAQPPGGAEHSDVRLVGEEADEARVELVQGWLRHGQSVQQRCAITATICAP